MDNRVKIVIGGAVVLLLLIILAIFFFLSNVRKSTTSTPPEENTLNNLPTLTETSTPTASTPTNTAPTGNTQSYNGNGFSLRYPNNWGLLKCSNSNNFEFDPNSATPTTIACNEAVKPVTVLVTSNLNCSGEAMTIGSLTAVKSKNTNGNYTTYRWCVPLASGRALDITHRIDPNQSRATSTQDYSSQIEEMIKTITTTPQGS